MRKRRMDVTVDKQGYQDLENRYLYAVNDDGEGRRRYKYECVGIKFSTLCQDQALYDM